MKRKLFVLFVLSLVFLSGCENGGDSGGKIFVGGSDALEISFVIGEPPERVLDGNQDPFDVSLLLKNVGEYDIEEKGIIASLQGISRESFSLSSLTEVSDFELEGKQKIPDRVIEGDQEELRFVNANYKHDLNADFELELRADVCYQYGTTVVSSLCLKKEPTKRRTRDTCEIDNANVDSENSGAPVHVKNVRQSRSGSSEVKFTFDIEKVGGGDVYDPNAFTNICEVNREKEDRVRVAVDSPSGLTIKCSKLNDGAEGVVKLISGKKTVTCRVPTGSFQETAYRERIDIYLDYFYKDSVSTDLIVENAEN